jgi:hypothetical protein
VPRGVYSVPVLGGAEQLVLEDAGYPEALPDGSLLAARYNSDRQLQLMHFWPETGRLEGLPVETSQSLGPARAFPDGREAVVIGTPIGPEREPGYHTYIVDLASGKMRRLLSASQAGGAFRGIAVTRDGKTVLAAVDRGNLEAILAIARNGHMVAPAVLTLTNSLFSLDTGADGSLYVDQVERPGELLRFSAQGGHAERIAAVPAYEAAGSPSSGDEEGFAVLPDGRAVLTEGTGGRMQLMVVEAGKDPVPLINTVEATSSPVTAAGPSEVAFLIGPEPRRTIALAAASNGRISRRIPFDKGPITSLASSPDGNTLYCAAGGNIWSLPVDGGAAKAKKIRAGDHVAADPSGKYLLVELIENPIIRFVTVPLNGGPEREIPRPGPLRPAFVIGPNAIGKDGRVVMPLGSFTWSWPPGLLDPATGQFTRVPVDHLLDYHVLNWTPDGKVLALGLAMRSRMWRFQPSPAGR